MLPNGYMEFFSHFLEPLEIKYNTIVSKITQRSNYVEVLDTRGNQFLADYVVVTVSLGILKKNYIEFIPKLSEEKTQLIKEIPVMIINKVMVEFEEKFWGNQFLIYLQDEKVPIYLGINFNKVNGKNILIFIVNDTIKYKLSSLTIEEIKKYLLIKLHQCYPNKSIKITQITKTNWEKTTFTQGSFSDIPASIGLDYVKIFRKPEGRVYFAGEHTSHKSASTQGAWLSGVYTAREIEKRINLK